MLELKLRQIKEGDSQYAHVYLTQTVLSVWYNNNNNTNNNNNNNNKIIITCIILSFGCALIPIRMDWRKNGIRWRICRGIIHFSWIFMVSSSELALQNVGLTLWEFEEKSNHEPFKFSFSEPFHMLMFIVIILFHLFNGWYF